MLSSKQYKHFKRQWKRFNKRNCKPYTKQMPLAEHFRWRYEDEHIIYEYGFLGNNMSDEEITEAVNNMWEVIYSPYDCTGLRFTKWIHTHKNPCGAVSFIACYGFDY